MLQTFLSLALGLILLVAGGEFLVRGAVQVARKLGVSPLVIGLTLVGFGTSMPELVTSEKAGLAGSPGIAFGNIVGSNIANILLIAGISAVLCPVIVARAALRRDAIVMLAVAFVFAMLAPMVPMGRLMGACLLAGLGVYLWTVIRQERVSHDGGATGDKSAALDSVDQVLAATTRPLGIALLIALGGLVLVVTGGALLVDGAIVIARDLGISETVMRLTVVAVGTSLPELVTSVVAALFVLVAATGLRINRAEGELLVAGYVLYVWLLWPASV
ncbi:calcium/sodium antiporter [Mesobacterium pallidum]|uniref:calcium/sodium antiporter n=1 Tax=Mesobacterium pallidum TaxID=2872037 RepID=UPI001EE22881|nr:calcium/sodium antiporter [Mesobacterium pallidum]